MKRTAFLKTCMIAPVMALPGASNISSNEELFSLDEIKEFVFAAHKDFDKPKAWLIAIL